MQPSNNPLQLVAVVCANLAGKTRRCPDFASWERKLRVYADNSVTAKEVQVCIGFICCQFFKMVPYILTQLLLDATLSGTSCDNSCHFIK